MSEEKLYVVEDDNRLHLAFNDAGKPMWFQTGGNFTATDSVASMWSLRHGGHAVTLVEEPEKVVLSEKQAEIVEDAHNAKRPASYIILKSNDEELLMNAYVNGYTVAKEKKWRLPVPSAWCGDSNHYWHKESDGTLTWSILAGRSEGFEFSRNEIAEYGMNGFKKEEVTDDDE